MSMVAYFAAMSEADAASLATLGESEWFDAVYDRRPFDMDKAWHGIHYVLTRSSAPTPDVLSSAVFGGAEWGYDTGYGRVRKLEPGEVQRVSRALNSTPLETISENFDPEIMTAEVYPSCWNEEDWGVDILEHYYPKLVEFYKQAAARGECVLMWIG